MNHIARLTADRDEAWQAMREARGRLMRVDHCTMGERLEALACHAQQQAADAHYFACVALAAGQWRTASDWQAIQRREADRAAGDVTPLCHAPAAWLELPA